MDTTAIVAPPAPFANREDYIKSIEAAGLSYIKQSGFLKVEAATGRRLYVAATNSVRRVDVSGWEHGLGTLTRTPKDGPFGQVKQQMVVGTGAAEDIARFETLLAHMLTLPAIEKEVKVKAPKAPKAKGGAAVVVAPAPKDPSKRLKEIENVKLFAAKRNTPVSAKLLAEEADLLASLIPASTQPMAEASES